MEPLATDGVHFSVIDAIANLPGHQYGYYRIRTALLSIKYLAFFPPKPTFQYVPDYRGDQLGFLTVPDGDWNIGHLESDEATDRLVLKTTEKMNLQQVEDVWHSVRVDESSLGEALHRDELQCASQMYSAIYPGQLGANQVVVNMEWYPDDIFGVVQETHVYARINGHGIGPRFLAHVTENGKRVCGYMLESLSARHATMDDFPACKRVLAKLHRLKIVYGTLNLESFLILDDRALLRGFGGSFLTDNESLFQREMDSLEDVLRHGSPSTWQLSHELNAEIFAIAQRDDGVHLEVFKQASEYGRITITEEEHKALLHKLREGLKEFRSHRKPF